MRKHLYLITEHEDEDRGGGVSIFDSRLSHAPKNEEAPIQTLDEEKRGFKAVGKQVHLGYVDFEDEEDYEENIGDAIQRKCHEVDDEHLEKAGVKDLVAQEAEA